MHKLQLFYGQIDQFESFLIIFFYIFWFLCPSLAVNWNSLRFWMSKSHLWTSSRALRLTDLDYSLFPGSLQTKQQQSLVAALHNHVTNGSMCSFPARGRLLLNRLETQTRSHSFQSSASVTLSLQTTLRLVGCCKQSTVKTPLAAVG